MRRGAATLRVSVMPDNGAAIALHERHGFTATDEPGDPLPGGVGSEVIMVKRLG